MERVRQGYPYESERVTYKFFSSGSGPAYSLSPAGFFIGQGMREGTANVGGLWSWMKFTGIENERKRTKEAERPGPHPQACDGRRTSEPTTPGRGDMGAASKQSFGVVGRSR